MTVIELFGQSPIDNVATCLSLHPDALILVGEEEVLQKSIEKYRLFFEKRNPATQVTSRNVKPDDINAAIVLLSEIVEQGDTCVIDLSGGNEAWLAAAGIVYDRYKGTHSVTLQRIDAKTNHTLDCDGDGIIQKRFTPTFSVKELIMLYGGSIVSSGPETEADATLEQLRPLWKIVTDNGELWNHKLNALNKIQSQAKPTQKGLCFTINFYEIQGRITDYSKTRALFDRLIRELHSNGILRITNYAEDCFRYTYKNAFLRYCLRGPGNVLEYKTLLEARALQKGGQPFFNDAQMGVYIDWDGIIHHAQPGGPKDTRNEIDVIAMRGLTPVFISCKNGDIEEVELYKLNTVADRFGMDRAKKVLIATNYQPASNDAKRALIQRADDMGIIIHTNVASLTDAQWQTLFLDIFNDKD